MKQIQRIIHDKEVLRIPYSIDDIAKEIQQLPPSQSVFTFFRQQIAKKEQMQCIGTKNNYANAANRFMEFRDNEDLAFSQMTSDMMEMYQAWLFNRGILGYVVNGIRDALCILVTDDTQHLLHLPIYLRLNELQMCLSVVAVRNNDSRLLVVPLFWKDMIVGANPPNIPLVNHLVIQCTLFLRY